VSALSADPAQTAALAKSLSPWPKNSEGYFKAVQAKIRGLVASGQLGVFANAYWGHPAYKLPPEVNLLGVAHYLDILEWQKEIIKVHAVFGGKNPHPHYLVGGAYSAVGPENAMALNAERLALVGQLIDDAVRIVDQVYIPDLLAVASFYKDWAAIGGGVSNYLSYGDLPTRGINDPGGFKFPRGAVLDRDLARVHEVDAADPAQITESVAHSWYAYKAGDSASLHPWEGETDFRYTGPKPPYKNLDVAGKYSWLKTPRWKGRAMEVGPLARLLVGYAAGQPDIKQAVDGALARLAVPATALFSTLGRTAARGIETQLIAYWMKGFYDDLVTNIKNGDTRMFNGEKWDPGTWPAEARGAGFTEAPRGALSHWIVIKDGKIANYQLVVPTTWNGSPRDADGQMSPYEAALVGTPVARADQPLEILRTIHSFDPCIACAVHLYDPQGRRLHQVRVV